MSALVTLTVLVSLAVTPNDQVKAAELVQRGWKLWEQQSWNDSEIAFAEAARLDPARADAWNGLGWARFNAGKQDEAVEAFTKCVQLEPANPAALNGLGQAAFMNREYDRAEQFFLKAPAASAAWYGLARLYLLQGRFGDAEKYAKKVLGQQPSDRLAQQILAAAKAKKLDNGLKQLLEPPATPKPGVPGQLDAFSSETQQGWALLQQGKMEEAIGKFRLALQRNPDELAAHNGLGFALINRGDAAEAQKHFEFFLKCEPNAAGPLNGLARCQMAEGNLDDAIATWEKMDKLPGLDSVHAGTFGLAEAYLAKKDYAKATVQLEKLVQDDPDNAELKQKLTEAKKHTPTR